MARAAIESLDGVEQFMMSGTRATLVLESGAELSEDDVRDAVESNGLVFESFEKEQRSAAAAAFVAKTPKFT
jgi:hypothetical protein